MVKVDEATLAQTVVVEVPLELPPVVVVSTKQQTLDRRSTSFPFPVYYPSPSLLDRFSTVLYSSALWTRHIRLSDTHPAPCTLPTFFCMRFHPFSLFDF